MCCRTKTVEFWAAGGNAGYVAAIYYEDNDGRAYVARWYGTREECEAIDMYDSRLRFVASMKAGLDMGSGH